NAELWRRARRFAPADRALAVDDLQTMYDKYFADGIQPGISAAESHDWNGIVRTVTATLPVYLTFEKALQKKIDDLQLAQSQEFEQVRAQQHTLITAVVASLLAALVIATAIVWRTVASYKQRLTLAVQATEAMALGDLTQDLSSDGHCEAAGMLRSLVKMQQAMRALVGTIHRSADMIHASAGEVAQGNAELAERTEQQAASLEQTAASMEGLTSTANQNAQHARQADTMAGSASQVASKGGQVIAEVVDTMASINAAAEKIVDIIAVIDGIAFQTNILALNAAVEAARAGDQGRGFAVVATEVRNLAQRSASAAKEIKTLIGNSVTQIATGTTLVDLAGSTMHDIVVQVGRVSTIIGQIAAASNTQTSGIVQINDNVTQMDGVVQQNVALVEEAAAAATSLQEQSRMLISAVQVFKCGSGDAPRRASEAPPRHGQRANSAALALLQS
ncbi:MAG: methyl-accepting chemotaxis protein, partial [Sphingomonadaceae bacterium]